MVLCRIADTLLFAAVGSFEDHGVRTFGHGFYAKWRGMVTQRQGDGFTFAAGDADDLGKWSRIQLEKAESRRSAWCVTGLTPENEKKDAAYEKQNGCNTDDDEGTRSSGLNDDRDRGDCVELCSADLRSLLCETPPVDL